MISYLLRKEFCWKNFVFTEIFSLMKNIFVRSMNAGPFIGFLGFYQITFPWLLLVLMASIIERMFSKKQTEILYRKTKGLHLKRYFWPETMNDRKIYLSFRHTTIPNSLDHLFVDVLNRNYIKEIHGTLSFTKFPMVIYFYCAHVFFLDRENLF